MAARLKVFTWSDGLRRYTVAASSRAKALEAWGFHRDLFKTGDAQQVEGGDDYDEAVANPGVSVERGLAVDVGKIKLKRPEKAPPKPKGPSKADRERVARLQAELDDLDAEQAKAQVAFDKRRAARAKLNR